MGYLYRDSIVLAEWNLAHPLEELAHSCIRGTDSLYPKQKDCRWVTISSRLLFAPRKDPRSLHYLEVDPQRTVNWPYSSLLPSASHKPRRRDVYSTTHKLSGGRCRVWDSRNCTKKMTRAFINSVIALVFVPPTFVRMAWRG